MKFKRLITVFCIVLLTFICFIFMNRNYDPLSRYPYRDEEARNAILKYMDEREIEYIVNFSIAPNEFMPYIDAYEFNAYNTAYYNTAKDNLYYLTNSQIVNVTNRILKNGYDFDEYIKKFMYMGYDDIMYILINGKKI